MPCVDNNARWFFPVNDNLVWDCVGGLKLVVSQLGNFVLGIRNTNLIFFSVGNAMLGVQIITCDMHSFCHFLECEYCLLHYLVGGKRITIWIVHLKTIAISITILIGVLFRW